MKITGFIWLDEIVEKIESKHNVVTEEVEEVFRHKFKIMRINKGHFRGEDVYRA